MLNNYFEFVEDIDKNIPFKKRLLYKLISLLLSIFFILPIVLIDINLLTLYYDLELLLVIILHLSFIVLVMLYTKFLLDCYKPFELSLYQNRTSMYLFNLGWSGITALIVFIIYLISRS